MSRLTKRYTYNFKDWIVVAGTKTIYEAKQTEDDGIQNAVVRLAEYEDAEEKGILIRLPCEEGTWVYQVAEKYTPYDSYRMYWEKDLVFTAVRFQASMRNQVGKSIFFTEEEAEEALNKARQLRRKYNLTNSETMSVIRGEVTVEKYDRQ